MIDSPICSLLGIRYPIFQGGMAWISDARLAAAVSNAGGLGIISAMNADAKYLRDQIRLARALTDKPFGSTSCFLARTRTRSPKRPPEERRRSRHHRAGNPSRYMERWRDAGIRVIPVGGVRRVGEARDARRGYPPSSRRAV
jgi:enoyl-[acyl-carrier protein] reductase II